MTSQASLTYIFTVDKHSFHTDILQNPAGRFYIGHTDDLQRRLSQHNDPEGRSHLGKYTHK